MFRSRFRDFDWVLLGFVLALTLLSVLEIRSATAMTKFHGFQQKQMLSEELCDEFTFPL